MANEAQVVVSLQFTKGNVSAVVLAPGTKNVDVSGTNYIRNCQTIGATEEAILIGDVGTLGYCLMRNLDSTNFVSIRPGTGAANLIKLKAGEVCLFRLAMNTPFAIADTAPVALEVFILPD